MLKQEVKINIIGAGVSGLVAAIVLENKGYHPVIFEKSDRVGGRVKTEQLEGLPLDHGFQVLLDAYPMAKKYLDYDSLNLQHFKPGSLIYTGSKAIRFGDPLRDLSFLFPTLFSGISTFKDKLLIFKLNTRLKKEDLNTIFEKEEKTTMAYLEDMGFSNKIINHFFVPFFGGIFLEPQLTTSSRMFEFVFKMFAEGRACIPEKGMEEIPKQLKAKLTKTKFHFNVTVNQVLDQSIKIDGLPDIESDYTIIATEANSLISNLRNQKNEWHSCVCMYFESSTKTIQEPLIGLLPGVGLVNNMHFLPQTMDELGTSKHVLSLTIVKENELSEEDLIEKVKAELKERCNIELIQLLKSFRINKALPKLESIAYDVQPSQTQLLDHVFLAGDLTLNASLNAAMMAGERAAEAVVAKIESSFS